MGGTGAPVEGSGDHGAPIDHGELVVQLVAPGQTRGADAIKGLAPGAIVGFQFAVAIRQLGAKKIENFAEGSIGKARIGQQADGPTPGLEGGQGIGNPLLRQHKEGEVHRLFGGCQQLLEQQ